MGPTKPLEIIFWLKIHMITSQIVALIIFLTFSLEVVPFSSETSTSYRTFSPFLPLSFFHLLSLSIYLTIPLGVFPLPTINVAFKMPIDLFP